jgi:hypothetical protein
MSCEPRDYPALKKLDRWQTIVQNYYDNLKLTANAKKSAMESAERYFDEAMDRLLSHEGTNSDGQPTATVGDVDNDEDVVGPEKFSEFNDKLGYSGRVLSKYRVDSMVMTVFNHRREFQELKMKSLTACLLKIDFNYKLARKIRVWTKQGQSFSPYKCIATIHNEDGLTVFWKALKNSESIREIEPDLVRLRNRLNRNRNVHHAVEVARKKQMVVDNQEDDAEEDAESISSSESQFNDNSQAVKVIYVDNCCQVKNMIRCIFPDVLIKLDPFHWLKRWNELLVDPSSAQAGIFRGLMSRAIFNIEPSEYERAKDKVTKKKKREATVKEVLKEANSVIPSPEVLRSNVEAVFHYVQAKDTDTMRVLCTRRDDDTSPKPKLFMKHWKTADVVRNQLVHVDLGCLSDPEPILVNIFRRNTVTDITYVARGTNTNERDNLDLAYKILTAAHIGIHRAERLMCCFFEEKNQQKAITRLAATDFGICHTEKLLLLNSYAKSVGFSDDNLPYNVTAPKKGEDDVPEFMGFSYQPMNIMEVSNPTDNANTNYDSDDDNEEEDVNNDTTEDVAVIHKEQSDLLGNILGDDLDIEVFATDEEYEACLTRRNNDDRCNRRQQQLEQLDEMEDIADKQDEVNRLAIAKELSKLLPTGNGKESTLDAFRRLSSQSEWLPFRSPDSLTIKTDIDIAEATLYQEWMLDENRSYSPSVKSGRRSFKQFETDWNNEVTRRFKLWSTQGEDGIVQLRYKSQILLKKYFDELAENASLRAVLPSDDNDRSTLDRQLAESRRQLPQAPAAQDTTAPSFHGEGITPLGAPTTLNSDVTAGSLRTSSEARTPYEVTHRNLPQQPPVRPRRKRFRSRKYCITCGFKRSDHVVTDEGVAGSCIRNYCGKCRERKQCHGNNGFGLTCTNATHPWQTSTFADWYEEVLS